MLDISDKASIELNKVLRSDKAKDKELVLFFQGAG